MPRSILVTGGTGFIGSHLCEFLAAKENIAILTSSDKFDNVSSIVKKKNVSLLRADISDFDSIKRCDKKFDLIFHLAGFIPKGNSDDDAQCIKINDAGTKNILEFARRSKCKKFIYSSSQWVYGHPKYLPIDEKHPCRPIDSYGTSKLQGELHCKSYAKHMNIIILRYAGVFGERKNTGAVYNFTKNLLEEKPLSIEGDGTQTNDYLYVKDAVQANVLALAQIDKIKFDIFNIGSGIELSANDLAASIAKLLNKKPIISYAKKDLQNKRYFLDISKAKEILKFQPTPLDQSLQAFIRYIRSVKK